MKPAALAAILVCTLTAAGPRLRIEPSQPRPGSSITVTYDRNGSTLEKSSIFHLAYGFTQFKTERLRLDPKDGRLTATIKTPPNAAFLFAWVEGATESERDDNNGAAWDTYFYDEKGNPVDGARQERAFQYSLRKKPVDATTVSLILLEEELRAYPENPIARARWWTLRYEENGKTVAAKDAILAEIRAFQESQLDKPWVYRASALGYNNLDRNPQALAVTRAFLKRFPADSADDDSTLFFLSNWGTLAEVEALPKMSERWLNNEVYWRTLFSHYERTKAEPLKFLIAGRQLLELVPKSKDLGGERRTRIAEAWLSAGADPAAAEAVAREAVSISEIGPKPSVLAASSANRKVLARNYIVAVNRSTLGWALFQQGQYEAALRELDAAAAHRDQPQVRTRELDYRRGRTLEKLNRPKDALAAYLRELAFGDFPEPTRKAIATLYPDFDVRNRVNELIAAAALDSIEPIEDVREKLGRFELRGPDGKPVDLSRYRDKTILIEFWATWCGTCLKSMEHTQKLAQAHPEKLVVFAVSQDDEETRPRAPEYLKKKGYDFVLLYDEERRRDLQVPYVPARFLVDKAGLTRIRESGWSASQEVVFEKKLRNLLAEP